MNLDFELVGLVDGAEYNASDLNSAREKTIYSSLTVFFFLKRFAMPNGFSAT